MLLAVIAGVCAALLYIRHIQEIPAPRQTALVKPAVDGNATGTAAAVEKPASAVSGPAERPSGTVARPAPEPPPFKPALQPVGPVAAPPQKPVPVPPKGKLIFVFDDAGHNLAQLKPFLELPFPCTIAVLPGLQYSAEAARLSRRAGKEVILHQPMQALNFALDPGPGAIKPGMTREQIHAVIRENLSEVGPVTGLNNHEGSYITADRLSMQAVFDIIEEAGIYFLDSRTNADTVAPALAGERGIRLWERAVFLDNSQDRASIIDAVQNGMKIAERKGAAIMIGHIWSNDLAAVLTEMYPELARQGFSLSTIAQIAVSGDIEE